MKDFDENKMNQNIYNVAKHFFKEHPFFSELMMNTTFTANEQFPTLGICVKKAGLNIVYNPKFLDLLYLKQNYFVFIHEFLHPLSAHHKRTGTRDRQIANIVQDMIINTNIKENFSGVEVPEFTVKQMEKFYEQNGYDKKAIDKNKDKKQFVYFIPEEYDGKRIFEKLYDWVMQKQQNREKDENGNGKPDPDLSKQTNEMLDSIDQILNGQKDIEKQIYQAIGQHLDDEVDEETKRAIVDEIIDRARNRGRISADVEAVLGNLRPARKNYLSQIKRSLSQLVGNQKRSTWQKPNRKDLPLKGHKKYKNKLNVISDESGSMSGLHTKVYKYLYRNDIEYNLIHIDTEIKRVDKIKNKRQLKEVKLVGFGGTELQPGIDYVKKNFPGLPTIILTDGYTDSLNFRGLKKPVLILTTDEPVPVTDAGGLRIKQIVIDKEYLDEV